MSFDFLLPIIILLSGGYMLIKIRFFFILHPISTLKLAFTGENTKGAILSLLLALAGTLGVGNIIGVAFGIAAGGAGSVFWLMVSALFSSALKYGEVCLCAKRRSKLGMIGVIKESFGAGGRRLAILYASLCLGLALSMGAALQGSAIRSAVISDSPNSLLPIAMILTLTSALICSSKGEGIRRSIAVIIPMAVLLYSAISFMVIFRHTDRIPTVIGEIFKSAFSLRSATAGGGAAVISAAMREGFARGLLSNEAGAGTSSLSHTALEGKDADRAGIFGIFEVTFDTLILCPMTAFAILLSGKGELPFSRELGFFGGAALFLSLTAFALSTLLCWYYYGDICRKYLIGEQLKRVYFLIFFVFFLFGILLGAQRLIPTIDFILLLLTILSTATLIKCAKDIHAPLSIKRTSAYQKGRFRHNIFIRPRKKGR